MQQHKNCAKLDTLITMLSIDKEEQKTEIVEQHRPLFLKVENERENQWNVKEPQTLRTWQL